MNNSEEGRKLQGYVQDFGMEQCQKGWYQIERGRRWR